MLKLINYNPYSAIKPIPLRGKVISRKDVARHVNAGWVCSFHRGHWIAYRDET